MFSQQDMTNSFISAAESSSTYKLLQKDSVYFKKHESKVALIAEGIKALSRQAEDNPTTGEVGKALERNLQLLMRMCKTGVTKPRAECKSVPSRATGK